MNDKAFCDVLRQRPKCPSSHTLRSQGTTVTQAGQRIRWLTEYIVAMTLACVA